MTETWDVAPSSPGAQGLRGCPESRPLPHARRPSVGREGGREGGDVRSECDSVNARMKHICLLFVGTSTF